MWVFAGKVYDDQTPAHTGRQEGLLVVVLTMVHQPGWGRN